jgi:hypothetical protein
VTDEEADKILYQNQLQEIPWQDAGRGFPAKIRRRAFSWGKAVIFLTTGYAQGFEPTFLEYETFLESLRIER